jgi:hypothetical protein
MPDTTSTPATFLQSSDSPLENSFSGLADELLLAWPAQDDLDHICALPICLSTHSHLNLCTPTKMTHQRSDTTRSMLQLPPPGSHPVLIARKLLHLGSLLQGALSASQVAEELRISFSKIMSRAIDTATRLVTTNDALTACVEGIECIILEGMIQNYAGKLHRAWMTMRRAAAMAELIGLHRKAKWTTLKFLDAESKVDFDPEHFCFRIVEMNRYLSITLGLPLSSFKTCAFTPEAIAACQPLDRIARLHSMVIERILTPENEPHIGPYTSTKGAELLLQKAASEMPSQWWLTPDFNARYDKVASSFGEVARILYQFCHYHLLIRIHLPYMLDTSAENSHGYSKLEAANAGRETLSRYIAFRKWNPGHFYCRGLDFAAFIALTTLCLAHIGCSHQTMRTSNVVEADGNGGMVLAQSHSSDRGLMERAVEVLQSMGNDSIASKLSRTMQHLLDVEAQAAKGTAYNTITSQCEEGTECGGGPGDEFDALQLNIPYFGTIHVGRMMVLRPAAEEPEIGRFQPPLSTIIDSLYDPDMDQSQPCNEGYPQHTLPSHGAWDPCADITPFPDAFSTSNDFDAIDDWTFQNINEALFSSIFSPSSNETATSKLPVIES